MASPAVLSVALLVLAAASAPAQEAAQALRNLPRVALELALTPDLVDLQDDLEQRVDRALREQTPAPTLDPSSIPKLRLVTTVRAVGATELRGFWLPFSGTYAVGTVRLEVERPVLVPGTPPAPPATVPAVVWQAERLIARPWGQVELELGGVVDELIAGFLEDYRRARAR
jgi:hypothetical protein